MNTSTRPHIKKRKNSQLPNIIYILADDMGYGDVSCLNEKSKLITPNFDRIAKDGILYTDAHASSAVCTPSRYSLLTGRYNWRSSIKKGVLSGYSKPILEDGRMTVASLLKSQGYETACIGKWHLGLDWEAHDDDPENVDYSKPLKKGPCDFGFDYFYGISASLDMPPYVYIENDKVQQEPDHLSESNDEMGWWRKGPTAPNFRHNEVLPVLTKKVLERIENREEAPFFIYFPLPAPHTPILPSKEFIGRSNTNSYGDFVLMCDDVVGQIIDKLGEQGLSDNTILIFASDNGCAPFVNLEELASYGHNPSYIFRGYKSDIYEGGHRVPLLVSWPSQIKAGSVCNESVCLVDFMATLADVVDVSLPDNAGEDSVSHLPLWLNTPYIKPLREATVHHSLDGSFSIRKGPWKLEMCPGSGGWSYPPSPSQSDEDVTEGLPPIQLYHLNDDISETRNVYDQYPDVVQQLKNLLIKYITEGRSTPGSPQENTDPKYWPELYWIEKV